MKSANVWWRLNLGVGNTWLSNLLRPRRSTWHHIQLPCWWTTTIGNFRARLKVNTNPTLPTGRKLTPSSMVCSILAVGTGAACQMVEIGSVDWEFLNWRSRCLNSFVFWSFDIYQNILSKVLKKALCLRQTRDCSAQEALGAPGSIILFPEELPLLSRIWLHNFRSWSKGSGSPCRQTFRQRNLCTRPNHVQAVTTSLHCSAQNTHLRDTVPSFTCRIQGMRWKMTTSFNNPKRFWVLLWWISFGIGTALSDR